MVRPDGLHDDRCAAILRDGDVIRVHAHADGVLADQPGRGIVLEPGRRERPRTRGIAARAARCRMYRPCSAAARPTGRRSRPRRARSARSPSRAESSPASVLSLHVPPLSGQPSTPRREARCGPTRPAGLELTSRTAGAGVVREGLDQHNRKIPRPAPPSASRGRGPCCRPARG